MNLKRSSSASLSLVALRATWLVASAALVCGCTEPELDPCAPDSGLECPISCDETCSGGTPFCDTARDVCVQCLDAEDCAAIDNGTGTCAAGACIAQCEAGFGDCDGRYDNGCENALLGPQHCGACGTTCEVDEHCAPVNLATETAYECHTRTVENTYTLGSQAPVFVADALVQDDGTIVAAGHAGDRVSLAVGQIGEAGRATAFVIKYRDGAVAETWTGIASDASSYLRIEAAAQDEAGRIFIGGSIKGSASLLGETVSAQNGEDLFIAAVAEDGTVDWQRVWGSIGDDRVTGLVYQNNTLFVLGEIEDTVGDGTCTGAKSPCTYVARFTLAGTRTYSASAHGPIVPGSARFAVTSGDDEMTTVGATFEGTLNLQTGTTFAAEGDTDAFLVRWSARSGTLPNPTHLTGSGGQRLSALGSTYPMSADVAFAIDFTGQTTVGGKSFDAAFGRDTLRFLPGGSIDDFVATQTKERGNSSLVRAVGREEPIAGALVRPVSTLYAFHYDEEFDSFGTTALAIGQTDALVMRQRRGLLQDVSSSVESLSWAMTLRNQGDLSITALAQSRTDSAHAPTANITAVAGTFENNVTVDGTPLSGSSPFNAFVLAIRE